MYLGGNLVFANRIFNGRGEAEEDISRQLALCRTQAAAGVFLPDDVKLA